MEHLSNKYKEVFDAEQAALLSKVLEYATAKHGGQTRASGEPYITHPIAVANILLEMGLDHSTIAAALLHDTIEDTTTTEAELAALFSSEIAELVAGVTKLAKFNFTSKEEEQAENFRRMYFAMAKDIRVILIKLADRLHNMRTIDSKPIPNQKQTARETLEIYAPLASRLGLSYIKCELEDSCLRIIEPEAYAQLLTVIPLKRAEREDLIGHLVHRLSNMLKELGIDGEVSGRPKHFYSIYKKMVKQQKTFDQIYDLTAVRVIVPSIKDCYEVLGMIHTVWKPIPGRFKDYISVPKANNYQSLHTTVMTAYGTPFEIQIRTLEMHKIAEFGVAAHWKYKENRGVKTDLDSKIGWLRGMMEETDASSQEFYESFKIDLYSGQVFIFTPRGDVVSLPEGSTPVDFAYSVHSEVGNKCVGAKVNSKMVPLETKLQTGDYAEIITSNSSKGPSRDWLRFVKSSQAKSKIRAFFKKEMKDEHIKRGHEMMEREAKARGYNLSDLMQKNWLDPVMQRYLFSSVDDLYASIGYGGYTVNQVLLKLIDFAKRDEETTKILIKSSHSSKKEDSHGIIVMGQSDLLVRVARCCSPVPGDDIVGFISRGRGVTVHQKSCPNLKNTEVFRLVDAHWEENPKAKFTVALSIETRNTAGIIAGITNLISKQNLSIESLNARVDKHNNGIITLTVNLSNTQQISALIEKISMIPGVDKVYRKL